MWRSQNNVWESVLSSQRVSPRDWTRIVSLGSKHLYLLFQPRFFSTLNHRDLEFSMFQGPEWFAPGAPQSFLWTASCWILRSPPALEGFSIQRWTASLNFWVISFGSLLENNPSPIVRGSGILPWDIANFPDLSHSIQFLAPLGDQFHTEKSVQTGSLWQRLKKATRSFKCLSSSFWCCLVLARLTLCPVHLLGPGVRNVISRLLTAAAVAAATKGWQSGSHSVWEVEGAGVPSIHRQLPDNQSQPDQNSQLCS